MIDLLVERNLFQSNYNYVAGIDEAGRGPLAGPVVAACVLLNSNFAIEQKDLRKIKDSKLLSEKKREEVFELLSMLPLEISIGICDHKTIDRINILQATFLAMKKAISALKKKPEYILLDGNLLIPNLSLPQKAIVSGDKLIFSIAAASIVAKVTRDKIMKQAHYQYPDYGFGRHKGYGTKKHMEQLQKLGPCPIHRRSFAPIRKLFKEHKTI